MKTLLLAASATLFAVTPMTAPAATVAATAGQPYYEPPPPDPDWIFRKPVRHALVYYNEYGSMQGYDAEYCDGTTESVRDGPGRRIVYVHEINGYCLGDEGPRLPGGY